MAYPVVDAPYGLKPINLIGGQVFAGSTRELPITYAYATNIFYGDFVTLVRGDLQRISVTTGVVGTLMGVFLGCRYTNPVTKQLTFSQYWPASTAAGDAVAIVCDDPDTVFKAAMVSGTTVIASAARCMIGQNLAAVNNTGSATTGNSANAVLADTSLALTAALPIRVMGLVPETAVALGTGTYASISTATVTLASALSFTPMVGCDVGSLAANGQYIASGSYVSSVTNSTTVVLNAAPLVAFASGATIVFTQYPEVLVKINFGLHKYYAGTAVA
tara:strand:+ start:173 stop:997 length:825 start_codon:yes stop_codon:yes gene_type:complete